MVIINLILPQQSPEIKLPKRKSMDRPQLSENPFTIKSVGNKISYKTHLTECHCSEKSFPRIIFHRQLISYNRWNNSNGIPAYWLVWTITYRFVSRYDD